MISRKILLIAALLSSITIWAQDPKAEDMSDSNKTEAGCDTCSIPITPGVPRYVKTNPKKNKVSEVLYPNSKPTKDSQSDGLNK
ncbi:MAG: hypothetical protein A2Z20_05430 [Bdellovibrionales bacterium RBG_16_40_8]|nr:MAG: hypothetical protein A2Z20_05430 [Bdellovibrionales bacterium RBG_16_40_8]